MNFDVIATEPFERKLKRLAKKYKSITLDLMPIIEKLQECPTIGISLGKDFYKIRFSITSKGKGKSGGARIITYVRIVKNSVFLMDIYDKSEQESITDKELQLFIDLMTQKDHSL